MNVSEPDTRLFAFARLTEEFDTSVQFRQILIGECRGQLNTAPQTHTRPNLPEKFKRWFVQFAIPGNTPQIRPDTPGRVPVGGIRVPVKIGHLVHAKRDAIRDATHGGISMGKYKTCGVALQSKHT